MIYKFVIIGGLAILIDLLNPEMIVIGSIYARCEDILRPIAFSVAKKEALPAYPIVVKCNIYVYNSIR